MSFLIHLQQLDHHHHHHHLYHYRTKEHDHMDSGGSTTAIRSYDCVFCQRGFTTAQALGGHMNIHRKDRANPTTTTTTTTNKPNIISPNKEPSKEMLLEEDDHADNTRLFYSSKSYLSSQNDGGSSSFEGRLHRFLGEPNPNSRVGSIGKRNQDDGHSMEGEELDLELRLGHYSW